ncbi:sensor domain-containing protein [Aquibacillus kalidii]|uniref:sensor domain-containing protein n=1 Tax=Aquibacillus kalidii TaxID=2762597 RepID=UPI00164769F0|nr:GGDEF domain-containing phosphodiesterase [Aquibacillus kalidii]
MSLFKRKQPNIQNKDNNSFSSLKGDNKLYKNYPTPVFQVDLDGKVIKYNEAVIRVFGYNEKEITRYFDSYFLPEYKNKRQYFLTEAMKGIAQNYQARIYHKNGDVLDVDVTYIPIFGEDEQINCIQGIARDITAFRDNEKELAKISSSLELAQDLARIGSWDYDVIKDEVYWSQQLYELLEIESDNFSPSATKIVHFVHPDDRERYRDVLNQAILENKGMKVEYRFLLTNNKTVFVKEEAKVIFNENQQPVRVIGTIQDITDQKIGQLKLAKNEAMQAKLLDNLEAGIWSFSFKKDVFTLVSKGVEILTGLPPSYFSSRETWYSVVHPDDRASLFERQTVLRVGKTLHQEYRIIHKNGDVIWIQDQSIPSLDEHGNLIRLDGIITNITSYKNSEKEIKYLAYHDYLTQLPNKRMFDEKLSQLVKSDKTKNVPVGLLDLNLDRFKLINNTLGFEVGDQLLIKFADRVKRKLDNNHTLFTRIGGDEFLILLWGYEDKNKSIELAEFLLDLLKEPFIVNGYELFLTTSIGISSTMLDDDLDGNSLRKNAGAALKRAKINGKNTYEVFFQSLNIETYKQFMIERDLRKSIEMRELFLEFQPIVNKQTGEITRAEALVRWRHPEWGIISPKEFIPLAEESGFILQIGDWVLEEVCMFLKRWEQKGLSVVPISINISAQRFLRNDWVDFIRNTLTTTKVNPELIELEITERSLIHGEEEINSDLEFLQSLGVKIALDDFGTGYSSLSYLKDYPVDAIKIDKAFVDSIVSNSNSRAILKTLVQLAYDLEKNVVVEGVETSEQLDIIAKLNCSEVQGYIFSKPVPESDFQLLLERRVLIPKSIPINPAVMDKKKESNKVSFEHPLKSSMTLVTINGKKVKLGFTPILINEISNTNLNLQSAINLPIRDDFIYRLSIDIMGHHFNYNGHIVYKKEVANLYEYDVVLDLTSSEKRRLKRLLPILSTLIKKAAISDNHFEFSNKAKYLKQFRL